MIEAELKARVHDPAALRERLRQRAAEEISVYHDTYYDQPGHTFTTHSRELRLRVIETGGLRRALVTFKEAPADAATGSKPEHETAVADPAVIDRVFRAVGLEHLIAFQKLCTNYRFTAKGRDMLATVVTVPEIDGVFIELETLATDDELSAAIADVRATLDELGIGEDDLTTELYTDAVLRARAS